MCRDFVLLSSLYYKIGLFHFELMIFIPRPTYYLGTICAKYQGMEIKIANFKRFSFRGYFFGGHPVIMKKDGSPGFSTLKVCLRLFNLPSKLQFYQESIKDVRFNKPVFFRLESHFTMFSNQKIPF